MNIIQLKNISYSYPDGTKALNKINIDIKKGSKVALLGENGSGKSTLFLLLTGIYKPLEGQYLFNEIDAKKRKDLFKSIGLVFQDPDIQLFAPTIYKEVSYGPINLGLKEELVRNIVDDALRVFDIEHLKNKAPHLISYGQKKRVSIADIYAMNNEVIILDEPFAWLDIKHKNLVKDVLDDLNKKGKTIILSTHNPELAYSWADNVIVLKNGESLISGEPETVFNSSFLTLETDFELPFFIKAAKKLKMEPLPKSEEEFLIMAGDK